MRARRSRCAAKLINAEREKEREKEFVAIYFSYYVHMNECGPCVRCHKPTTLQIHSHINKVSICFNLASAASHTGFTFWLFMFLITNNLTHMFRPQLMQDKETKLIWLWLTCSISPTQSPDYTVTFPAPLPDFRISLLKCPEKHFAIVCSVISRRNNHWVTNLPLHKHKQIVFPLLKCPTAFFIIIEQNQFLFVCLFIYLFLHEGFTAFGKERNNKKDYRKYSFSE